MKLKKPKFWDHKKPSLYSYIILPFTIILNLITKIKSKPKLSNSKIKTICIGNFYIGGTGKTSLAIKIKQILDKNNIKACFIKKFYQLSNIVFMGKSLSGKGGQNPLEPTNFGSVVLYGPNIDNFKDTYKLLDKLKVAHKVNGVKSLTNLLNKLILKPNDKKSYLKIAKIGKKILNETKDEINTLLNNEIKKT